MKNNLLPSDEFKSFPFPSALPTRRAFPSEANAGLPWGGPFHQSLFPLPAGMAVGSLFGGSRRARVVSLQNKVNLLLPAGNFCLQPGPQHGLKDFRIYGAGNKAHLLQVLAPERDLISLQFGKIHGAGFPDPFFLSPSHGVEEKIRG